MFSSHQFPLLCSHCVYMNVERSKVGEVKIEYGSFFITTDFDQTEISPERFNQM